MSDSTEHEHHPTHGDQQTLSPDGEVHPHIGSYKSYVVIFFALIICTLATVGVASVHLGPANLAVAVIIASIKAALVCTFFMHLKDDTRFHTLVLIVAVLFIGVFFAYTTNDTSHRAQLDRQGGSRHYLESGDKAPGGYEGPVLPPGYKLPGAEKKKD